MRIRSISLENVRGFSSLAVDFWDPITAQVRQRTVIVGSNGSGKTTLLEAIYELLSALNWQRADWLLSSQSASQLIVDGLPDTNTTASLFIQVEAQSSRFDIEYITVSNQNNENRPRLRTVTGPQIEFYGEAGKLPDYIAMAVANKRDLPNCIYFPSEGRLLSPKEGGQIIDEPNAYNWTYRFSDDDRWSGSLESFLVATYQRDLQVWYEKQQRGQTNGVKFEGNFPKLVQLSNSFLQHKQIVGVDQHFRLQIETDEGRVFGIDNLSSGEKQIIIFLGEIQRRLRRGGVLLIDEPEIHLHPRWQRLLVTTLTTLCSSYDTQMIITTQSQEIADAVYEHEVVLLDDIFERKPGKSLKTTTTESIPEVAV